MDLDLVVTFSEDGNYTSEGGYSVNLTYTYMGEDMVENFSIRNIKGLGTYRIEGDRIFTSGSVDAGSGQVQPIAAAEGRILELTENRMVLSQEEHLHEVYENEEVEIVLDMVTVLTR